MFLINQPIIPIQGWGPVRIFTVPCNMSVGVAIVQIFFMQIILGVTVSEQQTSGIMALKNLPYPLIHHVTRGIDRCRLLISIIGGFFIIQYVYMTIL